ncbi:MAG: ATP-binding protein [Coriobacteriales bacterium]|jgi:predicted AAA+ superfamily ATPase|nr:ATP-binding protein [Coriobacteriales bacterium]
MSLIAREIANDLREALGYDKATIVMGPRQVGKTTVLHQLFDDQAKVLWLSGDDGETISAFQNLTVASFQQIIGDNKILVLDEAQRIRNIGLKLKIIQDNFKTKVKVVATGSSSFDLANKINEPLTGRKFEYKMFPLTFSELVKQDGLITSKANLEHYLIYGCYPEVVCTPGKERQLLNQIANENLYKDVFMWEEIKRPSNIVDLLKALAYQVSSQVSISELAKLSHLDAKTVNRYLMFLEQSFVVFRLSSFSRNLRNELTKSQKFYFYDNGVRNAMIGAWAPLASRTDVGALFENYMVSELIKKNREISLLQPAYFWRTKQQQEIDYIEQAGEEISAYEFKWNPAAKAKIPKSFIEAYHPKTAEVITRENFSQILI